MIMIRKRNGVDVEFDSNKISNAIMKANESVSVSERVPKGVCDIIAEEIKDSYKDLKELATVEDVQDKVITKLMERAYYKLVNNYIKYRYQHELQRQNNPIDTTILQIVDGGNDETKEENSNKNTDIISTQRDYMAGEISKEISRKKLIPPDILQAHDDGMIHIHDLDYFIMHINNCCLINMDDILQNGTVISETLIEKPHRFLTACNIATQVIAQVASSQFGGQSVSLTHLAKFVDVSRKLIEKSVREEMSSIEISEEKIKEITEKRLKKEIRDGIQTIQYQILTLLTTNGQTPFVTVFLYLNEAGDDEVLKKDLAACIEEMLRQRIRGVKNEVGVYVTPAFPKLIYVLEEDNISENSEFFYLTRLAAECTAKRMVPDYVSEKEMLLLKGDTYPCMGCTLGDEVITYRLHGQLYIESSERMWNRISEIFPTMRQRENNDKYLYIDTPNGVEIYDTKLDDFTKVTRLIKNHASDWRRIKFNNGRCVTVTHDHPFETENRGVVYAKDLRKDDVIRIGLASPIKEDETIPFNKDLAWVLGVLLCDSSYAGTITLSIAAHGEDEIEDKFRNVIHKYFGLHVKTIEQHRGFKGNYKDLRIVADDKFTLSKFRNHLISEFGGIRKLDRHIPNMVFRMNSDGRRAFLAGMIDADGYINEHLNVVTIGSTNKELSIQQALLAKSLGYNYKIYMNRYKANSKDHIKYSVYFPPDEDLINEIACNKKRRKFDPNKKSKEKIDNTCNPVEIEVLKEENWSYDVTTESEHFELSGIYSHNCRSFLTPDRFSENTTENISGAKNFKPGEHKYYGRFNCGVVSVNLPFIAMKSSGDINEFWKIMNDAAELCHRALQIRISRLLGTKSDVAPILWQYGGLARLKKGEVIDKLIYDGYATASLGYAGLFECVKYMTGYSHTDEKGKKFALEVMKFLNEKTSEWKYSENIDYSLYGTPLESTTYKFARALRSKFGVVKDISDHNYITNSYHVNVREKINAFDKLAFESEFQKLSPGGAISYVEVPDMSNNIEAVISVMQFIYDNILYAELNTKSDYCHECGYNGKIEIINEGGKLLWECPQCGNRDQNKMNVARRTCGYIGTQFWNQGRTEEIKDRVEHL